MNFIKEQLKSFSIFFLLFCSLNVSAQERASKEKIEALKIAFVTEKLELTEQEAQDFWPLYHAYIKDKKNLKTEMRHPKHNKINFDEMTDAEITEFIDNKFAVERKSLELKEKYYNKVKLVLPIRKVAMLTRIERQFRAEVLKRLREKRN